MFDLQEELKKLPVDPGVYLMHDEHDTVIYVGKAVNLRNRVRQYFRASYSESMKKDRMVPQIARFEYIITDNEVEALILESNLIKEYQPKYNTMLRDDKSYPYIKVTLGEDFPRVLFSRDMKKDKSQYFGPYTYALGVRDTIDLMEKLFQVRTCNRVLPRDIGKARPCLNYYIKRCTGPCNAHVSKEDYKKQIDSVISFLSGNYQPILKEVEGNMKQASEDMDFEKAIELRELYKSIQNVTERQKISNSDGEDNDIIAMAQEEDHVVIQVFFIRDGHLIGRDHFRLTIISEDTVAQVLASFLKQFYSGTPFIPKEVWLPEEAEDGEVISQWLTRKRGQKVSLRVPQRGNKGKLMELATKNAQLILGQDRVKVKQEEERTIGALKQVGNWLGLTDLNRIEAFDISNLNGFETVGSMIVYEKGQPHRSDYRKFKLRSISGPDDYGSMYEVLTRRFSHGIEEKKKLEEKQMGEDYGSFTRFPDLIMMDGGKGQVNIALQVLEELDLDIPVCGMVKDDRHRTRGLYFKNTELPIDKHSQGFRLITRIQDEAHRFAIEYHRSLRSKEQVHSVLDDIPGIGPARRKALMKHFLSLNDIRQATVEELQALPAMDARVAQKVYEFFHPMNIEAVINK